jgi:hypothetical protein
MVYVKVKIQINNITRHLGGQAFPTLAFIAGSPVKSGLKVFSIPNCSDLFRLPENIRDFFKNTN